MFIGCCIFKNPQYNPLKVKYSNNYISRSISFVLVTSSIAFFLLSLCYVLVDVKKWWSGKPFLFAGMNAILMYIGHELTGNNFPMRWYPHDAEGDPRRTHFIAVMSDSWGTFIWILVSYYLYKINYFFVL